MMSDLKLDSIIDVLKKTLGHNKLPVALHEPAFLGNEWAYVKECLDTGWVSSAGSFVSKFEEQLAEFTGAARAIAVVNGTAALHICLKLAGVETNDEVLVPTLTFVATANAVTYCGAIPHFVDCDEHTLGLSPSKLEAYLNEIASVESDGCYNKQTGRRIKAVVPVHVFGHPVDLDPLLELCQRFNLELVEDAAESLGSFYKGRHTGNWGIASAISFNGNKIITTGGGGAILTNDLKLGALAKHITATARVAHEWEYFHDQVGFNYRLPNINAALGCAQLEQLPKFVERKRALADRYKQAFKDVSGVRFFVEPEYAKSNYWLNVLILDQKNADYRGELFEQSHGAGFSTRPTWHLMHKLPMYVECPRMILKTAESLATRIINIPSSVSYD